MKIKYSFSLIFCFFLVASFILFPHGTVSRILLQEEDYEEADNGHAKAEVSRSRTQTSPSREGKYPPPTSTSQQATNAQSYESQVRSEAEQEARREACEYTRAYTNAYCDDP